jgi:hypothetical protein
MFGDPKKTAAAILAGPKGSPPPGEESEAAGLDGAELPEDDGDDMGLEAAADDLIAAVKGGSASAVASALRNAFAILESEPHEEG